MFLGKHVEQSNSRAKQACIFSQWKWGRRSSHLSLKSLTSRKREWALLGSFLTGESVRFQNAPLHPCFVCCPSMPANPLPSEVLLSFPPQLQTTIVSLLAEVPTFFKTLCVFSPSLPSFLLPPLLAFLVVIEPRFFFMLASTLLLNYIPSILVVPLVYSPFCWTFLLHWS